MLKRLEAVALAWLGGRQSPTRLFWLGRSVVALSSALTLSMSSSESLYPTGVVPLTSYAFEGFGRATLFQLPIPLDAARWIGVLLLLIVASGWRPRVTGWIHWWVALSFWWSGALVDGGDQLCAVLSLLLLPACVSTGKRWQWEACGNERSWEKALAVVSILAIQVQMSIVYLQAGVAKTSVAEWANGTAMYYLMESVPFGPHGFLRPVLQHAFQYGALSKSVSWAVIGLEIGLGVFLFLRPRYRTMVAVLGVAFHLLIIPVHGITSFSIAMIGALLMMAHVDLQRAVSGSYRLDFRRLMEWWTESRAGMGSRAQVVAASRDSVGNPGIKGDSHWSRQTIEGQFRRGGIRL